MEIHRKINPPETSDLASTGTSQPSSTQSKLYSEQHGDLRIAPQVADSNNQLESGVRIFDITNLTRFEKIWNSIVTIFGNRRTLTADEFTALTSADSKLTAEKSAKDFSVSVISLKKFKEKMPQEVAKTFHGKKLDFSILIKAVEDHIKSKNTLSGPAASGASVALTNSPKVSTPAHIPDSADAESSAATAVRHRQGLSVSETKALLDFYALTSLSHVERNAPEFTLDTLAELLAEAKDSANGFITQKGANSHKTFNLEKFWNEKLQTHYEIFGAPGPVRWKIGNTQQTITSETLKNLVSLFFLNYMVGNDQDCEKIVSDGEGGYLLYKADEPISQVEKQIANEGHQKAKVAFAALCLEARAGGKEIFQTPANVMPPMITRKGLAAFRVECDQKILLCDAAVSSSDADQARVDAMITHSFQSSHGDKLRELGQSVDEASVSRSWLRRKKYEIEQLTQAFSVPLCCALYNQHILGKKDDDSLQVAYLPAIEDYITAAGKFFAEKGVIKAFNAAIQSGNDETKKIFKVLDEGLGDQQQYEVYFRVIEAASPAPNDLSPDSEITKNGVWMFPSFEGKP